MVQLESESRKRTRRANIKKIILETVTVAGVLSVAVIAPNVLGAMAKMGLVPGRRQKEIISASRVRLVRQGLLEYRDKVLRLTPAGEKELRRLRMREYVVPKPKRWDHKWRVLIFDIPEKRKSLRNKIRHTLVSLGFIRLQDSVWLYPYDCEDLITLLKAEFYVGKDLLYIIADSIEHDAAYRRHFKLT